MTVAQSQRATLHALTPLLEIENISLQCIGKQGKRSGESARLPTMWPGFDSRTRRDMRVEFVVGFPLCSERFFSGFSGFPLSSKRTFPNPNSILECSGISERVLVNFSVVHGKTFEKKTLKLTLYSRASPILTIFHRVDVVV